MILSIAKANFNQLVEDIDKDLRFDRSSYDKLFAEGDLNEIRVDIQQ